MERLYDDSLKDWISAEIDPVVPSSAPGWKGHRVSGCVPSRYQAYAKIFHPIYEDPTFDDVDQTWDEWSRSHPDVTPLRPAGARRLRWAELASRYGLRFHAELTTESFTRGMRDRGWPRRLFGPAEGTLDPDHALRVAAILHNRTPGPCNFTYFPVAYNDMDNPFSLRAALIEMPAILDLDVWTTPEYWWPEDKTWCVCTDYDLEFTLVGGDDQLIDAIVGDDLMEAIEVRPEHRVDKYADSLNS